MRGTIFDPIIETMNRKDLEKLQEKKLKSQVEILYTRSRFHRSKFDEAGIKPGDIKTLGDIEKLPLISRSDLVSDAEKEDYILGSRLCVPLEEAPWVLPSPEFFIQTAPVGTALTIGDHRFMVHQLARQWYMIGIDNGDIVQIQSMTWEGITCLYTNPTHEISVVVPDIMNCMVIPVELLGPDSPRVVHLARYFKPRTLFTAIPDIDNVKASAQNLGVNIKDLGYQRMIFRTRYPESASIAPPSEREKYSKEWDVESFVMLDIPDNIFYAVDCPEHQGLHFWEDAFIVEVVDPETGERKNPNEVGKLVISNIFAKATPLIRFLTDIDASIDNETCTCGRTHSRIFPSGYS